LVTDFSVRGCQRVFNLQITSADPVFPAEVQAYHSYRLTGIVLRIQGHVFYRDDGTLWKVWFRLTLFPMSRHTRTQWHRQS